MEPDTIEEIARAIIIGSGGERAANHAQEFDTGNWADAKRSAREVLPIIDAEIAETQRYAAGLLADISDLKAEISTLRDCVVTYGDKVRMANAANPATQQAIDRAFDREP